MTDAMARSDANGAVVTTARVAEEVRIYAHSPIVFWWMGWVASYVMALATMLAGVKVSVGQGTPELVLPQSAPHVAFSIVLVLLVLFTNVKMRGIYSITFVVATMFVVVLFAYLDWWDRIFELVPYLTVHINLGFYLFFGTCLFVLWAATFFIFDRLTYWLIRPGQIIEARLIGGGQRTFDTEGLQFEQRPADLFQQTILGLGAGDIVLRTGGVTKSEIIIQNVLFASDKLRRSQRLLAVRPDAPLPT
jgi:hypothetical protein